MATTEDKDTAVSLRAKMDTLARGLGHDLTWRLGRHSLRRGFPYHFLGRCRDCGAEVTVDAGGAWCAGDKDAREAKCEQILVDARRS